MSGPVDVLDYLDALIASHRALSADAFHAQELPKAVAAYDAVAELIESLDAYLDDSSLDNRMNLIDSRNRISGQKSPAWDRELPRVGGAS